MSLAYRVLPSEVDDIGASDIDMLTRYWNEEPWGSLRDNLHAALIAREVRSTAFKGKHEVKDFMLARRKTSVESRRGFFDMFRTLAKARKKLK